MGRRIEIDLAALTEFCSRWCIVEFALFGSVLRPDFGPGSDVDILVEFEPGARIGFMELAAMEDELADLFGRKVDLVSKRGLNARVKEAIMASREIVFAA